MEDIGKIIKTLSAATSPLPARLGEMNRLGPILNKFEIHDAEKFFLAIKDLLCLVDQRSQGAVHKFISTLLKAHPKLIELQGNRIFKSIRKAKSSDDTKLKAFQLYTEQCADYIVPSKGFFSLISYFFSHLHPQCLGDILVFFASTQQNRPKGGAILMIEILLAIVQEKLQIPLKATKRDKSSKTPNMKDPGSENLGTLLGICEIGIHMENFNVGVIECIAMILCLAVNTKHEDTIRIFMALMEHDYKYYLTSFLLSMLNNAQVIDVKARVMNREAVLKKKADIVAEYSYKSLTDSLSTGAQELLKRIPEEPTKEPAKQVQNDGLSNEAIEHFRDRMLAGAIFLIGTGLLAKKKQYFEDVTLMTILGAYRSALKQRFKKSALQVMVTFEWLINAKGCDFDEEWTLIFECIQLFVADDTLRRHKEGIQNIRRVFAAVRNVYVSGQYKGNKEMLMDSYLLVKDIINDSLFDTLYMNYLRKFPVSEMQDRLAALLDLPRILKLKESEDFRRLCDYRIQELIGSFENFYRGTRNIDTLRLLERFLLRKVGEWNSLPLAVDCRLAAISALKAVAMKTAEDEHFAKVVRVLADLAVQTGCENQAAPPNSRAPSNAKVASLPTGLTEDLATATAAHQCLFHLFRDSYLKYPPIRLINVLDGFLDSLNSVNKEVRLLTLRFLNGIAYDRDFYLYVPLWKSKSYLNALDMSGYSFPPQKIATAFLKYIKPQSPREVITGIFEVLSNLCKSHYSLVGVDLTKLLDCTTSLLGHLVKAKDIDQALKIVEFLGLAIAQRDLPSDPPEKQIASLAVAGPLMIFGECLVQLEQVAAIFKAEIEEFKKTKSWRKAQNSPTRMYQETGVFQKPFNHKLAKLAKSLLSTIGSSFYVCRDELLGLIEGLIMTMKLYVSDHVLAEEFVGSIQGLISDIYYSGFAAMMTIDNVINLVDICVQTGWRNIFYVSDQLVLPLPDYLKSKALFSTQSTFAQVEGPELDQIERKHGITVSQLTFPGGESGKRMVEELESRLRVKGRTAENLGSHFGYQNDTYAAMHDTTQNIIRLMLIVGKSTRAELLPYLSRVAALETRNEQSLIVQQSLILAELAAWYCYAHIERIPREKPSPMTDKGKLWVLNDALVYIETSGRKARVEIRNIVSCNSLTMDFNEASLRVPKNPKDNIRALAQLHDLEAGKAVAVEEAKEAEVAIGPEYVMANFPYALFNRANERSPGWEPVQVSPEIQGLVDSLDDVDVHDTHDVAVIYVPPDCEFKESEIYSVKICSPRFEAFLSELGTFVNVKECSGSYYLGGLPQNGADGLYGIVWRDELSQTFFHVNTLMQHIDQSANRYRNLRGKIDPQEEEMVNKLFSSLGAKDSSPPAVQLSPDQLRNLVFLKIKRHFSNDNVGIIWNESGKEVPEEFMKESNFAIVILIMPFVTNYCCVRVINMLREKRPGSAIRKTKKHYGPLSQYQVIHGSYLAKPVARAALVADILVRKVAEGNEKQVYISNFLKRCEIIKDIKKKAWLFSKGAKGAN